MHSIDNGHGGTQIAWFEWRNGNESTHMNIYHQSLAQDSTMLELVHPNRTQCLSEQKIPIQTHL